MGESESIREAKSRLCQLMNDQGLTTRDWSTRIGADSRGPMIVVVYTGTVEEEFKNGRSQIPRFFEGFRIVIRNDGPAVACQEAN